jgi:3-deoxy-manno-octulosonate cytidylyltransferase (CMP-KDO synthetase)
MNTVIVIPSRYESTRFPGKPLALVKGTAMLERVWRIAKSVKGVQEVYIATDDKRIEEFARKMGAKALMTPVECKNGTERVYRAMEQIIPKPDAILNFQGDALLTPPWVLQAMVDVLGSDKNCQMITPAVKLSKEQYAAFEESKKTSPASGTTVVFDNRMNALYFSKRIIPFVRDAKEGALPVYRHIGMYGYRREALERYLTFKQGPLESSEKLEQLRALENGMPIRVVVVDYKGRTHASVDAPEDVVIAEKIIEKEGELI